MSRRSRTHVIAVLRQRNGELQEDVVHRRAIDGGGTEIPEPPVTGEVVATAEFEEPPARHHPAEPVPGTLAKE